MRLRLPRSTVRRLMAVVVIVGLVLGVLTERRDRFRKIAEYHQAEMLALVRQKAISGGKFNYSITRRMEQWHEPMWSKYKQAARYPWLPVDPDSPEPEWED